MGCGLVVEVVAHYGGGVVEEGGDFGVGLVVEDFFEEVGVVAAAGLDEEFFDRGALAFLLDGWFWIGWVVGSCLVFFVGGHGGGCAGGRRDLGGVWAVGEEDVPLSDDVVLSHRRWFSVEGHLRWGRTWRRYSVPRWRKPVDGW